MSVAAGSRAAAAFARARGEGRVAVLPYQMAGYPSLAEAGTIVEAMVAAGADGFEIAVPFSDPMADGLTMQRVNERALAEGATAASALDLVRTVRGQSSACPVFLMSYYNPILAFGEERFCREASAAGADGLIVPDLPPEEAEGLRAVCAGAGLDYIYLLGPTSTPERLAFVGQRAAGFIYCVALVGVTGARTELASGLDAMLTRIRAVMDVPLVVGFGISQPEHVRSLAGKAEGAIVASALADLIESTAAGQRAAAVGERVRLLRGS